MSHSDDHTSPTTTTQEPPIAIQDYNFLDSDETGMSLFDVPRQNQQEIFHQDFSFLQSWPSPGVSPMNTDETFFEYPTYFGRHTMNTEGNTSLDFGFNMGSQRNAGFTMIPTPGKTSTNNNTNNGETCLSIQAANNSGRYTDINNPFGSISILTIQQIEHILDLSNMGFGYINNLSILNITSHSGLQFQSQAHAQMSHSNLVCGNKSNVSPYYGRNNGNTKRLKMMPNPGLRKRNTNHTNNGQTSSSVKSSLTHQQQHRVLTEPQWTKILKFSDINNILYLNINFVQRHILIHLTEQDRQKLRETEPGVMVTVYDHDTNTLHNLYLGIRQQVYILWKGWKKEFVERRELQIEEKIGLFWDPCDSMLHLSVLSRANRKAPAEKKNLSIQRSHLKTFITKSRCLFSI